MYQCSDQQTTQSDQFGLSSVARPSYLPEMPEQQEQQEQQGQAEQQPGQAKQAGPKVASSLVVCKWSGISWRIQDQIAHAIYLDVHPLFKLGNERQLWRVLHAREPFLPSLELLAGATLAWAIRSGKLKGLHDPLRVREFNQKLRQLGRKSLWQILEAFKAEQHPERRPAFNAAGFSSQDTTTKELHRVFGLIAGLIQAAENTDSRWLLARNGYAAEQEQQAPQGQTSQAPQATLKQIGQVSVSDHLGIRSIHTQLTKIPKYKSFAWDALIERVPALLNRVLKAWAKECGFRTALEGQQEVKLLPHVKVLSTDRAIELRAMTARIGLVGQNKGLFSPFEQASIKSFLGELDTIILMGPSSVSAEELDF